MNNFVDDTLDALKNKGKKPSKTKKEFKPPKKISERYLYNSGLAYLQRFPASSMHFKTIMMRKINKSCHHHKDQNTENCVNLLDALIIQLQALGLLDDKAYLKGMVTSLRRRGLSSLQIQNKLTQKGYNRNQILGEVTQHDSEEYNTEEVGDYYASLTFARKKKLGPFDKENKRDPEKSLAIMARAGYSYDIAKKTLNMNEEDLPEDLQWFT